MGVTSNFTILAEFITQLCLSQMWVKWAEVYTIFDQVFSLVGSSQGNLITQDIWCTYPSEISNVMNKASLWDLTANWMRTNYFVFLLIKSMSYQWSALQTASHHLRSLKTVICSKLILNVPLMCLGAFTSVVRAAYFVNHVILLRLISAFEVIVVQMARDT